MEEPNSDLESGNVELETSMVWYQYAFQPVNPTCGKRMPTLYAEAYDLWLMTLGNGDCGIILEPCS
jgi:hypothetical protein